MKKLFSLTATFLFISQLLYAEYFKHIGMSDGLNQFSVMTIYQDTLGRMWFGTKEGISVYNGNDITSYRAYTNNHLKQPEQILIGNDIYTIQGNRKGDVFIIADQSLLKYDIRRETFQRLNSGNTSALASYKGDMWCVVRDSIYLYNEETDRLDFVMKSGFNKINWLTVTADKFYIGTSHGLYMTDRKQKNIQKLIPDVDVYRIFESSQGEIWVGCRMEGLYRISPEGRITQVPFETDSPTGISSYQIREFVEDHQHNIWFGTFDGLHKYDSQTGKYSNLRLGKERGGLEHSSIFSLYKDRQGTIWIGSYFGGVNYFNPEHDIFSRYDYELSTHTHLYFSYISSMVEDKDHNLWIGTDGGGLSCMKRQDYTFKYFTAGKGNSLPHNNVKSICYDEKRNQIYIGTHIGGLSRYDIRTGEFHNYRIYFSDDPSGEPNNIIYAVQFHNDRLYISARNGLFMMNPNNNSFRRIYSTSQHFDVEDEQRIWLGIGKNVICIDPNTQKQMHVIPLESHGCNFDITKIKSTKSGVYIATLGSGLFYYDKTSQKVTNYSVENGQLLSNYCYNLAETNQGNILITSNMGIMLFSPIHQEFRSISLSSEFPGSSIVNGCGVFIAPDNEIFVGDVEGITAFRENNLKMPDDKLKFYLSSLSVNNQRIYPGDGTRILDQSLPFVSDLHLRHDQNNLIISFALSNYVGLLQDNWYEYMLEGFDKEWIPTKQMNLYYTNLDPGKYILRIRAQKGSELSSRVEEISQHIFIAQPWYNTFWAWTLYVLIVSLFVFYFVRSRWIKRRLALSLERERFEKQQIEQMNHAKLLFFTNVSHEFRTPLTLIISHIDLLLQNMTILPPLYSHIVKIDKHARRMRNLVTELLDFRKFDQNHITLKIAEQNLVDFTREIYLSFLEYAKQRNITYCFSCNVQHIDLWFDARQMEKVFFNLISNAFKYTPKGGTIEIAIREDDDVHIVVTDNGTGIAAEESRHIFDRFYQAGNEQKNKEMMPGTGIGLALTKSIVEKHHGSISVESEVGRGSIFSVQLLRGKEHFLNDEHIRFAPKDSNSELIANSMPSPIEIEEVTLGVDEMEPEQLANTDTQTYTLLIVEDNEDLLKVLQQLFTPFYKTLVARNGRQGLEMTVTEKPDLIVSDVMMPEMTGTEMCIQIKNNIDTCHIPIVLLTALNTIEQNIEGLNRGADDYITKPFNARMLLARCNNLIRNRLLIQQQFTRKPISEIDLTAINPLDKDLLKQTVKIIDEHIDDPEFDIPQLCKELGMGRTLLYAKFKALTGMTPNNFMLNHKLKKAAAMLRSHPEMQVAEIAYSLGFGSPIYFSRCFKSQFNTSPQSYRSSTES